MDQSVPLDRGRWAPPHKLRVVNQPQIVETRTVATTLRSSCTRRVDGLFILATRLALQGRRPATRRAPFTGTEMTDREPGERHRCTAGLNGGVCESGVVWVTERGRPYLVQAGEEFKAVHLAEFAALCLYKLIMCV